MIDPASLADWTQASLVAALLGGLGAACGWALREEERVRLVTARLEVAGGDGSGIDWASTRTRLSRRSSPVRLLRATSGRPRTRFR
jgi:hypothetical protein